MGSVGRGVAKRGTGEVASMSAGLRMMGRVMGGTPTCSGEVKGCRISGGWANGGGPSGAGLSLLGLEAAGDPGELLLAALVLSGFSGSQAPTSEGISGGGGRTGILGSPAAGVRWVEARGF